MNQYFDNLIRPLLNKLLVHEILGTILFELKISLFEIFFKILLIKKYINICFLKVIKKIFLKQTYKKEQTKSFCLLNNHLKKHNKAILYHKLSLNLLEQVKILFH